MEQDPERISISHPYKRPSNQIQRRKKIVTEEDVKNAKSEGKTLYIDDETIITDYALDTAKHLNVKIEKKTSESENKTFTLQETSTTTNLSQTVKQKKICIGSDHAGFKLKEEIKKFLNSKNYEVLDVGTYSEESVDYPDFAYAVAVKISNREFDYGIIVDGAGIGSAIVANKLKGVRAANCFDEFSTKNSRLHNNANVLTFGSRNIHTTDAIKLANLWLNTPFEGDRHQRRIEKITRIEEGR